MRLLLAVCFVTSIGCGEKPPAKPNIVLIVMDTLRAQNMSLYGAKPRTTPHLDRFSQRATLYSRSIATSPWTLPTHASMFTGLHPSEHGARVFRQSDTEYPIGKLGDQHTTLAEHLRKAGYETAGYTTNTGFLNPAWGLNQGFDIWLNQYMTARDLNQKHVFPWLRRKEKSSGSADDKPWFLFINYMDTHEPYNTARVRGFPDKLTNRNSREVLESVRFPVMMRERPRPSKRLGVLEEQYNVSIANVDRAFGNLIELLEEADLLDSTLIVITSDHGQFFGEHDLITHWKELYQPVLWVPLMIGKPGQADKLVSNEVISSVDIPGLVLESAGLTGRSGKPGKRGDLPPGFLRRPGKHDVISEIHFIGCDFIQSRPWGERLKRERVSQVEWPWKCIWSSDGELELYNLATDPREKQNRIDSEKEIAKRMLGRIDAYISKARATPTYINLPDLTEPELKKLRALGYLGD